MNTPEYYYAIVWITSIATVGTLTLALIGIFQLVHIRRNRQIRYQNEIKWKTEEAYVMYKSAHFNELTARIYADSHKGSDYTGIKDLNHDIVLLINYFESLAVGIKQGIYNENMMRDYLKESMYKSVKVFLLGESGEVRGRTWKAGKVLIEPREQPFLMELYNKWYPNEPKVVFQSKI